jgi:hypothetical protein
MKKEDKYREAADKIWELSKQYIHDKQIMNILRDCASELHIESRKNEIADESKIPSLYLIKDEFNL